MDWDRIMTNAARGSDFAGRGAADEQAYFKAFAGRPGRRDRRKAPGTLRQAAAAVPGFVRRDFMAG